MFIKSSEPCSVVIETNSQNSRIAILRDPTGRYWIGECATDLCYRNGSPFYFAAHGGWFDTLDAARAKMAKV